MKKLALLLAAMTSLFPQGNQIRVIAFGVNASGHHPRCIREADTVRSAMERAHEARGSHSFDHSGGNGSPAGRCQDDAKGFGLKEINWSGRQDSNLRPPGPEPGALPS